jgi:hypothetical protein
VAERIRLSSENVQLREELSKKAEAQATSQQVLRLTAANIELEAKLEIQVKEKDDEIDYLRKHLGPSEKRHKKSQDQAALLREIISLKEELKQAKHLEASEMREKKSNEDALLGEIASLKGELELQKKLAARSFTALKESSICSLRLLQAERDST